MISNHQNQKEMLSALSFPKKKIYISIGKASTKVLEKLYKFRELARIPYSSQKQMIRKI